MQLVNQLIGVVNQVAFLIILVLVRGHVHIDTSVIYQREGIRAVIVIDQGVGVAQQLGNGIVLGFYQRNGGCGIAHVKCRVNALRRYIVHPQGYGGILRRVIVQLQFQSGEQAVAAVVGIARALSGYAELQLMVGKSPGSSSADILLIERNLFHIQDGRNIHGNFHAVRRSLRQRVHVKGYFYFRIDDALYLLRVCHIYVQGIFRSLRSVIDMEVIHIHIAARGLGRVVKDSETISHEMRQGVGHIQGIADLVPGGSVQAVVKVRVIRVLIEIEIRS